MRVKRCFLIILLCVNFSSKLLCDDDVTVNGDDIIANIEDEYNIKFSDLKKYVNEWMYKLKYPNKFDAFTNALDNMIINQIKVYDFFNQGFHKDINATKPFRRTINEEILVEYFKQKYIGKYASEEYAKSIYKDLGLKKFARQIVINKSRKADNSILDSIRSIAKQIETEAKDSNFINLIKRYSQDIQSANNGGLLPEIGFEESLISSFNNTIFNMKENEVRIIELKNAISIVKVEKIINIEVEPFEKIKDKLIKKLHDGYYDKSLEEYDKDKNGLIDTSKIIWRENSILKIVEWSKKEKFFLNEYQDTIKKELESGNNFEILKYNDRSVDLNELLRIMDDILIVQDSKYIHDKIIKKYIVDALSTDEMLKLAYNNNYEDTIFNPETKNDILKTKIIRQYNNIMIDKRIPEPSEKNLYKFYEENRDSIFFQLDKINIYVITKSIKEEADSILKQIKSGIDYEKTVNRMLVKTYIREKGGKIKSFGDKEKPYLAEYAFKLNVGEVSDVIEYIDDEKGLQYAIIKCIAKQNEKQLEYDEVRNRIKNEYNNYYYNKISSDNIDELKKKYKYMIFKDEFMKLVERENDKK